MAVSLDFLPTISFGRYLQQAEPRDVILTASNRLAREIRLRLGERASGGAARLPDVFSLSQWLRDAWQQLRFQAVLDGNEELANGTLLSETQETLLWESVLEEAGARERLLFLDSTVEACMRSATLVEQYAVPLDHEAWEQDEESAVFRNWYRQMRGRCRSEGWMRAARLPGWLASRVAGLSSVRGRRFLAAGFEEPSPAIVRLFTALAAATPSMALLESRAAEGAAELLLRSAVDADEETRAAARWAAQLRRQESGWRIAVVVPDLAARRARVEDYFLEAEREESGAPDAEPGAFNLTLGPPLDQNPTAQAGLRLLQLLSPSIALADIRYFLRCPYFARAFSEREARAALDVTLLKRRREEFSLDALLRESSASPEEAAEELSLWRGSLETLRRFDTSQPLPPPAWAAAIRKLWTSVLWLGEPELSSHEFQARHRALEELGAMAELDRVAPRMRFADFQRLLRRRFASIAFQPESAPSAVLVAGLFEVTGLQFDAVWICGLNDDVLPRPTQPDPFLPRGLQTELAIPRSAAEHERGFAERTLARMLRLAPRVVLSYRQRSGEETLQTSPLLEKLAISRRLPVDALALGNPFPDLPCPEIDLVADWQAAPLPEAERAAPRGAQLLADQSSCPFRAFASTRLGSEAPEADSPLMNRMDQGNFVHTALERFWALTRTQQKMLELSPDALRARIQECVLGALEKFRPDPEDAFAQVQWDAERERIQQLLERWMECERSRRPFTVLDIEKDRRASIGELTLKIRPDRVDRLADESVALIDYKTGFVSKGMWEGDRPKQPQLLLYLAAESRKVGALAFASLKASGLGWEAEAQDAGGQFVSRRANPRTEDQWQAYLQDRRQTVHRLAGQFRDGFAPVDPAPGHDACKYCTQHSLCRIAEQGTDNVAAEEDPE